MLTPPFEDWPKVPYVGVGCIVVRGDGHCLLVRDRRGFWSPPGGHLNHGESLEACAIRETAEETGVTVTNVAFVALTNDLLPEVDRHYVTVWMCADADANALPTVGDPAEIDAVGWFAPAALPEPRHLYFKNLLAGRCLPLYPTNLPFS